MSDNADPVVFVWPGDLHLTDPDRENHKAAQWMVEEVNTLIRPDFVQFAGDNVQHATEEQFLLFRQLCAGLKVPYAALVGDHDVHHDPLGLGHRRHMGEPYGAQSLRGFRFIRLNTLESRPVGLSPEQMLWFRYQVDLAVSRGEQVVVMQHHYPFKVCEEYAGPGLDEWREITQTRRVTAVFSGHTHYGQIANDGRNIYVATRSIGEPEGGPAGYAVVYLSKGDLAIKYRSIQDEGPFAMITHPRDALLCTGSRHIVSAPDSVRARTWSLSPITAVHAIVDNGRPLKLDPSGKSAADSNSRDWEGPLGADPLAKGEHTLEIQAIAADGKTATDQIRFVVDRTNRYTAVPRVHPAVAQTRFC